MEKEIGYVEKKGIEKKEDFDKDISKMEKRKMEEIMGIQKGL